METTDEIRQYPNTSADIPNFINEKGTKFWICGELCRIAKKRKVEALAMIMRLEEGYTTIILIDKNNNILHEDQRPAGIECHIEMLAMAKHGLRGRTND